MTRKARVALAARWAAFYRGRGYNPLPSRHDAKRPWLATYRQFHDAEIPGWMLTVWRAANIQLCTGVRWNLVVVDLDGPAAIARWEGLAAQWGCPPTWTVAHDPARGRHLWFRAPDGLQSCKSRILWCGTENHSQIELIGDRALIIAPPSYHITTCNPYSFLVGYSPSSLVEPAELPWWVLGLEAERPRVPEPVIEPVLESVRRVPRSGVPRVSRSGVDYKDVIDAIPDKLSIARSWGLRVASVVPNGRGWVPARVIGREDRNPSASFNVQSGHYCEMGPGGQAIVHHSFPMLGVVLGAFPNYATALAELSRSSRKVSWP